MTSRTGSTASSAEPLSWAPYETRMGIGWIGWSGSVTDRSVTDRSVTDQSAIGQIVLPGLPMPPGKKVQPTPGVIGMALRLTRYFDGSGEWPSGAEFIDSAAATPFEAAVYRAVTAIPPGNTMTYADVASQVGHPGAARAIGAAMAKNRFAPMIPCHRVVGTDGSLRGYAGGIAMKRHLLEVEAAGA